MDSAASLEGIEAIPELIRRLGTRKVFAMMGETNVAWVVQGVEDGAFELVKTRHEETAVNAATGYTRVTGELGVCTVTRGPGFGNSVNALTAATKCHSPALLIVAESPAPGIHPGRAIQMEALVAAIGAGFHHAATSAELEARFWEAVDAANWNGVPQVLSVSDRIYDTPVTLTDRGPSTRQASEVDPESVAAVVDVLERAKRPIILAGQGAVITDCREDLVRLAGLVGARVGNSMRANYFFEGVPHNLGISGSWSPKLVLEELSKSDVVFGVGASLNNHTLGEGTIYAGAKIIHCEVDIDQPCMATAPELALFGDARDCIRAVIAEWEARGLGSREVEGITPTPEEIRNSLLKVDLGHDPSRGLDPRHVYTALDEQLPEDRIVVTDLGRFIRTLMTLLPAQDARSWVVGQGHGSIGLGLGLAVGAAAAGTSRPVVLVCGDGGFMMSSHDLDSVVANGLDVIVAIVDDELLGAEVAHVRKHHLPLDALHQPLPDIPLLAASLGGKGYVIRTEDELADLPIKDASGLTLLDLRVDPEIDLQAVYS